MSSQILLVEDNEMNRDMLSRRLTKRGFSVLAATTGKEALEMVRTHNPDLVLMDAGLPDISGWDVTRQLRSAPESASLPIIALTAHALAGDREQALAAGCDDYESKPVDLPALLVKIERLLAKGAAEARQ
jgi:CheY-like chemotaxis protein